MSRELLHLTTERHSDGSPQTRCLVCSLEFGRSSRVTKEPHKWNRSIFRCDTSIEVVDVVMGPTIFDPKIVKHLTVQSKPGPCLCCEVQVTDDHSRTNNRRAHGRDYFRCNAIRQMIVSFTKKPLNGAPA